MSGDWYGSESYEQCQPYYDNVNRYPTPNAKSNAGDYDEYYSTGSTPQTRGQRPYAPRGGRGQYGYNRGRGNTWERGTPSRGRGNFGVQGDHFAGGGYSGSRGGSVGRVLNQGRPYARGGRSNGNSLPPGRGYAGPQRGRGGNAGSDQQFGVTRGRGGFNQHGNPNGKRWNNGQQQPAQAKKRQIEISPSRWATTFDKPLPQQLLAECTPSKCGVCDVEFNGPAISKSHYDGKSHDKKVKLKLDELITDPEQVPKKVKIDRPLAGDVNGSAEKRKMICELCNVTCGSTSCFEIHMNGKSHNAKVLLTQSVPDAKRARCDLCGIEVSDVKIMESHLQGKSHKKKLKQREVPSSSLFCELCNVTCSDLGGYNQHLKGKRHADNASGKSEQVFKCEPCQMDFQSKDSLIIHNVGDGHKLAVSKLADASGSGGAKIIDYAQIEGGSSNMEEHAA